MKKFFVLGLACISLIACSSKGENAQQAANGTVALADAKLYGDEKIATDFGTLEIEGTYITKESIEKLNHQLAVQRAVEVYQWTLANSSVYLCLFGTYTL